MLFHNVQNSHASRWSFEDENGWMLLEPVRMLTPQAIHQIADLWRVDGVEYMLPLWLSYVPSMRVDHVPASGARLIRKYQQRRGPCLKQASLMLYNGA